MGFKLVWKDEFHEEGKPSLEHWHLETGGHGFGNAEAQYYTDRLDNVYVKEGILHIVGKKEAYENCEYTSAKLTTKDKHLIMYGRIEVMAKIPRGLGTWPAIWLLGDNMQEVGWPTCGEIDLMEHVGHNEESIHFSLHALGHHHLIGNQPTCVRKIPGILDDFHEFALEWDPQGISFFLDGKHEVTFLRENYPEMSFWPFDQPFYLILNLALGGTWGGPIDDTIFPVEFLIKYVKVYERSDDIE